MQWRDGRRIWLLDTPGFDDTNRSDADVLQVIASVLIQIAQKVELAGIIYLHPIVDVRMHGAAQRNLAVLRSLCGQEAYKCVTLVTTMWEQEPANEGIYAKREMDLLMMDQWWGNMPGATHKRHYGTSDSAQDIINHVLIESLNNGPCPLQITQEMLDDKKPLQDTAAGREVNKGLHELQMQLQRQKAELENEFRAALRQREDQLASDMAQQKAELEIRLRQAHESQSEMKVHFDTMLRKQTQDYTESLRQLEQQRDQANKKLQEFETQLRRVREESEEERQQFQSDKAAFETKIRELEGQNQRLEAERKRAEKERHEAYYISAQQNRQREESALHAPYSTAVQDYSKKCAACDSRRNIVMALNINLFGASLYYWRSR